MYFKQLVLYPVFAFHPTTFIREGFWLATRGETYLISQKAEERLCLATGKFKHVLYRTLLTGGPA